MPRDETGRWRPAYPSPEHWAVVADNNAQSRALRNLALHSSEILTVERDDAGRMLVGYVNGTGVRRTAIYDRGGQVLQRRNW
jgi:hypothetical protein